MCSKAPCHRRWRSSSTTTTHARPARATAPPRIGPTAAAYALHPASVQSLRARAFALLGAVHGGADCAVPCGCGAGGRSLGMTWTPARVAGVVFFVLWGLITHGTYAGTGDEPHYQIIAHSLAFDRDLDLTTDYSDPTNLALGGHFEGGPHVIPGKDGRSRPVHDIGLPVLFTPDYFAAYKATGVDHLTGSGSVARAITTEFHGRAPTSAELCHDRAHRRDCRVALSSVCHNVAGQRTRTPVGAADGVVTAAPVAQFSLFHRNPVGIHCARGVSLAARIEY